MRIQLTQPPTAVKWGLGLRLSIVELSLYDLELIEIDLVEPSLHDLQLAGLKLIDPELVYISLEYPTGTS